MTAGLNTGVHDVELGEMFEIAFVGGDMDGKTVLLDRLQPYYRHPVRNALRPDFSIDSTVCIEDHYIIEDYRIERYELRMLDTVWTYVVFIKTVATAPTKVNRIPLFSTHVERYYAPSPMHAREDKLFTEINLPRWRKTGLRWFGTDNLSEIQRWLGCLEDFGWDIARQIMQSELDLRWREQERRQMRIVRAH